MITYKHFYDKKGKPFATMCILTGDNHKAIGISICGDKDNFSKKIGRNTSFIRAFLATLLQGTYGYIRNTNRINVQKFLDLPEIILPYKSIYYSFK
jgi:hypothetical protein